MTALTKPRRAKRSKLQRGEGLAGWLFTSPMLLILGLFLLIPVLMALWVSFSDWSGRGSPLSGSVNFVGLDNYRDVTSGGGLDERNFGISMRNNAWYVVLVVPIQTALSLFLALLVNRSVLRGRGIFRTAFYFPSVTSSVAITVLWLFLFSTSGVINKILSWFGVNGPNWFNDPRGVVHVLLDKVGISSGPEAMTGSSFLGISLWEWSSGPSIAMFALILMAIFTTSGTFMLLFLAALQNVGAELDEAGMLDGAGAWRRFWSITLPQLRPTVFTVVTLGLIGTWQVFDQIYTGTQGAPGKTTLTPAFLSYQTAFTGQKWGHGSAIAFILFVIIILLTLFQRWALRERPAPKRKRLRRIKRRTEQGSEA
ncbi:MAG TPA: sugar ABC transporter permease [Actinomycetales bacterium]|nr:sugar ABC transporter permease [Actinomycetales bacterium]